MLRDIIKQYEIEREMKPSNPSYLLSSKWIDQLIQEVKILNKENPNMSIINEDIVDHNKQNLIQYEDDEFDSFLKEASQYQFISESLWLQLKKCYQGYNIKRRINVVSENKTEIVKPLRISLVPLYKGQQNFLESYQQINQKWSVQDVIRKLEIALQKQILIQVPKDNFIQLYHLKNKICLKNLIELLHNNQMPEIVQIQTIKDIEQDQIVIMDIKKLNESYYFQKQEQQSPFLLYNQLTDFSMKGLAIYERQQTLLSCMLKCYECIDKLRNSSSINILNEAYNGTSNIIFNENEEQYEFFPEKEVVIQEDREDSIYIYKTQNKVKLNNTTTTRQLIEQLLNHFQLQCDYNSVLFECSNLNYTEQINVNLPSNTLKKGFTYQIRKLMPLEHNINNQDRIEIKVHKCTFEDEGYKNYINFEPIYTCFISKWAKFQDLHLLIANLFQQVDFNFYKNSIYNKEYSLIYQTDQYGKQKCTYCQQNVCNNCEVPFNDKTINFKSHIMKIYVICKQAKQYLSYSDPIISQEYQLKDYFDVDWANEDYLILNINQSKIKPITVNYYFQSQRYMLYALIEKINNLEYQSYILMNNYWYLFSKKGQSQCSQPKNNLDVVKLFYIKKY